MTEIYWEEVPGATWADIREGWKYDWVDMEHQETHWGVISSFDDFNPDEYGEGASCILLRVWKPVERPKPTVAFVNYWDVTFPAFEHENHYYDARDGGFIDRADQHEVRVICEGVVVPAWELRELRRSYRDDSAIGFTNVLSDFFRECEELGVFGNE